MKKKSKRGLITAIVVIGTTVTTAVLTHYYVWSPNVPDVPKTEKTEVVKIVVKTPEQVELERRIELLKPMRDKLWLRDNIVENGISKYHFVYYIAGYGEEVGEIIWVDVFEQDGNTVQEYRINGLGEEIFIVRWEKKVSSGKIVCTVSQKENKLEYEPSFMGEEKAKELFEKGRQYYLEVRKHFGVSTSQGLEAVIREKLLGNGNLDFK